MKSCCAITFVYVAGAVEILFRCSTASILGMWSFSPIVVQEPPGVSRSVFVGCYRQSSDRMSLTSAGNLNTATNISANDIWQCASADGWPRSSKSNPLRSDSWLLGGARDGDRCGVGHVKIPNTFVT